MTKDSVRHKVWDYMEKNNLVIFPRPSYGRIPNFIRAKLAGERIKELKEFKVAKCIFSAPDGSLIEARRQILLNDKKLLVALPHITGYRQLHGKDLASKPVKE